MCRLYLLIYSNGNRIDLIKLSELRDLSTIKLEQFVGLIAIIARIELKSSLSDCSS